MRKLWIWLTIGVLLLALAGCGGTDSKFGLEAVKKRGVLRIGTDDTYPPMEFRDEAGNLLGFDIDLGNEIGKRMGLEVQWIPAEWEGIIPSLQQGNFDLIMSSMNITEQRAKEVDFVHYLDQGLWIVVAKGNPKNIHSLEDLAGKTVAVQIGTTNEAAARRVPGANVVTYDDFESALLEVSGGRADATILDTPVAAYYILIEPDKYEMVGEEFDTAPVGIAVNKKAPDLKAEVERIVQEIKQDGTMDRLKAKWKMGGQ